MMKRAQFSKIQKHECRNSMWDVAAMTHDGYRETLDIDEMIARLNAYSAAIEQLEYTIREHKLERVFGLEL